MKIEENFEKNCVELSVSIPFVGTEDTTPNIDLVYDCIGTYAPYLIKVLEERMVACHTHLMSHLGTVVFNNGFSIRYKRDDGSLGTFNIPSYNLMRDAIAYLKKGNFDAFLNTTGCVEQALKAIMNHPNVFQEDKGGFRYSQLISILMEAYSADIWAQSI